MIRISLILLLLVASASPKAQPTTDEQLAGQYFNDGVFDKAILYFEKLYNGNRSDYYYGFYLKCLIELKQFDDARKLIKKQSKNAREPERFDVDLGLVHEAEGDGEKANEKFEDAIGRLDANYTRVTGLGRMFVDLSKPEFALKTYERGAKIIKSYPFLMEKAQVFASLGRTEEMINTYLDLLDFDDNSMPQIQSLLTTSLDFEEDGPHVQLLRSELLRRVQKNPSKTQYNEMLVWYFIQKKDFNSALLQTKALDKRRGSMGRDIFTLSQMCAGNRYYDVAVEGLNYIINELPQSPYVLSARTELLSTLYLKVTTSAYTQQEVNELEEMYERALSSTQLGRNTKTIQQLRELAHIKGFYLDNTPNAIKLLEEGIAIPGIPKRTKAELQLDLADMLLLAGDIWEASLLYMQVEKEFKEDVLGHEAKFRNARVFYFSGSFDYAKAQLDVLKASTSKLIANDALQLSLLIMDNLAFDTTLRPLQLFALAELMIYQHQPEKAIDYLDSLNTEFTGHPLTDEVLYKRFQIAEQQRNFNEAVKHLKTIIQNHPRDILADDAIFNLGDIYQYQLKDEKTAVEYYRKIMFEYTGSLYAVESRKRFREITERSPEMLQPEFDLKQFEPWPENPDPEWLFNIGVDRKTYNQLREKHAPKSPNP